MYAAAEWGLWGGRARARDGECAARAREDRGLDEGGASAFDARA